MVLKMLEGLLLLKGLLLLEMLEGLLLLLV